MKEESIKFIKRCENCPNLGSHVHYDGIIEAIPDNMGGIEIARFNSITSKVSNIKEITLTPNS